MAKNTLLTVILTITIAIIVTATVMIPVFSDTTETERTFTNVGYFNMTDYSDSEEFTASWDSTTNLFTVNDTDTIDLSTIDVTQSRTIIACDTCALRLNAGTPTTLQFFIGSSNVAAGGDNGDLTVTASNGSLTATNGASTPASRTTTYEKLYSISSDGEWTMKKTDTDAYMNGGSFFMGAGLTAGSSAIGIVGLTMSGDIDDGATVDVWRGTDITISNIDVVKTEHEGFLDLYDLEKVTFTATDADSDSLDITYTYFIVPVEVTAEHTQHLSDSESAIIMVIPVLIICAILVFAVGMVTRERD